MKRQLIASSINEVKAWKQAAQWLIDNGHCKNNASVQALARGVDDDDWGDHCLNVQKLTFTIGGHTHQLFEGFDGIMVQPVLPDQPYIVQLAHSPYTVQVGLPTPLMIQQGEGEGYYMPPESKDGKGMWRFRDDSYDAPDTKYTKVRVFRNPNER